MSSLVSMMPLHSAIASARLTSVLSVESQSWGLIPQGESLYLPLPFCFFACKMKNEKGGKCLDFFFFFFSCFSFLEGKTQSSWKKWFYQDQLNQMMRNP